jgi:hypothetical protein
MPLVTRIVDDDGGSPAGHRVGGATGRSPRRRRGGLLAIGQATPPCRRARHIPLPTYPTARLVRRRKLPMATEDADLRAPMTSSAMGQSEAERVISEAAHQHR